VVASFMMTSVDSACDWMASLLFCAFEGFIGFGFYSRIMSMHCIQR
jgi:hypothetical protein